MSLLLSAMSNLTSHQMCPGDPTKSLAELNQLYAVKPGSVRPKVSVLPEITADSFSDPRVRKLILSNHGLRLEFLKKSKEREQQLKNDH